jgi:hypothetical protein
MTKLQDILHAVAVLGATLGSDFVHSDKGKSILAEVLAAVEAGAQLVPVIVATAEGK